MEKIQKAILENRIEKVYSGRDNCCRCGCRGKYYTPENKMFKSIMKRALEKLSNPMDVEIKEYGNYFNISYGNDRAYTIYFK